MSNLEYNARSFAAVFVWLRTFTQEESATCKAHCSHGSLSISAWFSSLYKHALLYGDTTAPHRDMLWNSALYLAL